MANEEMVNEFVALTGAGPEQATQYLSANEWNLMPACQSYFQDEDERRAEPQEAEEEYTGPRTLDGRPAPEASSSVPQSKPQPKKKGVATLGSLGSGGPSHQHAHDHDSDDDDDDEDPNDRGDLFAGGEKSGLAVQDPRREGGDWKKVINNIEKKARANAARPDAAPEAGPSAPSTFRGTGMTLGGEGVESQSIPDPQGASPRVTGEVVERILHIWQDGFSVDDGELLRFDDPANRQALGMIQQGHAPLDLMNVPYGQPVDVKLEKHDEKYTAQPKRYKPFGGEGRRLGAPVPGDGSETVAPQQSAPAPAASSSTSSSATPAVDSSQPTIMIRVQMPDGTRLPARFNTTQTLEDVYGFVQGASSETRSRPWVLSTTFPNKEHTDKSLVLGEMAEFKKGGTAVVKWT